MSKMFILGRLGRDAEMRYTPNGNAVINLAVAYNYGVKGEDGNRPSQWVDASLWGKRAEVLAPYLIKGSRVAITMGNTHIETYEGRNGSGHKLVGEILDIELASDRSESQGRDQQSEQQRPRSSGAPTQNQQRNANTQQRQQPPRQQQPTGDSGFDDMSDDIPF